MNSNMVQHLPELRDHGPNPGIWCDSCQGVSLGTCPAVFCIWPARPWIWLSGDPSVCGLCLFYRERGSPLPCLDHEDDSDCDGHACDEGSAPLVASRAAVEAGAQVALGTCEEITCS